MLAIKCTSSGEKKNKQAISFIFIQSCKRMKTAGRIKNTGFRGFSFRIGKQRKGRKKDVLTFAESGPQLITKYFFLGGGEKFIL